MAMAPFSARCAKTATTETRALEIMSPGGGIDPGTYMLEELFCDEAGCDCRRVILAVRDIAKPKATPAAHIQFGWEPPAFYARRLSSDLKLAAELKGPSLEDYAAQGPQAEALLDVAKKLVFSDANYIARLQRHYREYKATLGIRGASQLRSLLSRRGPGGKRPRR